MTESTKPSGDGSAVARQWVLACVDHSAYANSVCDHAGWFASHPDVGVDVLHILEGASPPPGEGDVVVKRAVTRLGEEGVGPLASRAAPGEVVDVISRTDADIVVMGKRGADSIASRTALGSNIDATLRHCRKPICLAPKVFLPIHRALVLLDADLSHGAALDFILGDSRLAALPLDVLVIARPDEDPDPKVEWTRGQLSALSANVFSQVSDGLGSALIEYMQSRAADMIIMSRAVLSSDPEAQLLRIEKGALWSTRTPVLIC